MISAIIALCSAASRSPVDLSAESRGRGLELFQVLVQPRHRVQFDSRGQVAQRFPLRNAVGGAIALRAGEPHGRVVPTDAGRIRDEGCGGGWVVVGWCLHDSEQKCNSARQSCGEYFGDVLHANRFLLAADQSFEVHQARHIGRRQNVRTGSFMVGDAVATHHARNGFFGNGKQAAEAATFVGAS